MLWGTDIVLFVQRANLLCLLALWPGDNGVKARNPIHVAVKRHGGSRFNEGRQVIFGHPVYDPAISSTKAAASSVCIVYPSPDQVLGFVTYTNTPMPRVIWKSIAGGEMPTRYDSKVLLDVFQ